MNTEQSIDDFNRKRFRDLHCMLRHTKRAKLSDWLLFGSSSDLGRVMVRCAELIQATQTRLVR